MHKSLPFLAFLRLLYSSLSLQASTSETQRNMEEPEWLVAVPTCLSKWPRPLWKNFISEYPSFIPSFIPSFLPFSPPLLVVYCSIFLFFLWYLTTYLGTVPGWILPLWTWNKLPISYKKEEKERETRNINKRNWKQRGIDWTLDIYGTGLFSINRRTSPTGGHCYTLVQLIGNAASGSIQTVSFSSLFSFSFSFFVLFFCYSFFWFWKGVANHTGGYDRFTLDITSYVQNANNELIVYVYDPSGTLLLPSFDLSSLSQPLSLSRSLSTYVF